MMRRSKGPTHIALLVASPGLRRGPTGLCTEFAEQRDHLHRRAGVYGEYAYFPFYFEGGGFHRHFGRFGAGALLGAYGAYYAYCGGPYSYPYPPYGPYGYDYCY